MLLPICRKKTNGQAEKWPRHVRVHFTEEKARMANEHTKKPKTLVFRKMQISVTLRFHFLPIKWAKIAKIQKSNNEDSYRADGRVNWYIWHDLVK